MYRRLIWVLLALLLALPALAGVNVNTASVEELDALPGIGPSKATAIVEHREAHGPFGAVEDLGAVQGIGPSTLVNLRGLVTVGDGTVAGARSPHAPPADAVDVNSATAEVLETLPGIGATKAAAIVADRDRNGPFEQCDALTRVPGIGPATVRSLGRRCLVAQPAQEPQ